MSYSETRKILFFCDVICYDNGNTHTHTQSSHQTCTQQLRGAHIPITNVLCDIRLHSWNATHAHLCHRLTQHTSIRLHGVCMCMCPFNEMLVPFQHKATNIITLPADAAAYIVCYTFNAQCMALYWSGETNKISFLFHSIILILIANWEKQQQHIFTIHRWNKRKIEIAAPHNRNTIIHFERTHCVRLVETADSFCQNCVCAFAPQCAGSNWWQIFFFSFCKYCSTIDDFALHWLHRTWIESDCLFVSIQNE